MEIRLLQFLKDRDPERKVAAKDAIRILIVTVGTTCRPISFMLAQISCFVNTSVFALSCYLSRSMI